MTVASRSWFFADARQALFAILLLFSLFPYFSPVRLGIDTSPLYLVPVVGLIVIGLVIRDIVLDRRLWIIASAWLLLGLLTIVKGVAGGDTAGLRFGIGLVVQTLLIATMGVVFAGIGGEERARTARRQLGEMIFWAAWIWLGAALLQLASRVAGLTAGGAVVGMLVSAARTTEGRGITALAAEPSFAGITCCVLGAAVWVMMRNGLMTKTRALTALSCYVLVTLLTVSLTSYVALLVLGVFVARRVVSFIGIGIVIVIGALFLPWDILQDLRIVQLLQTLVTNPSLILLDVSTASRVSDVLGRLLAMGEPHGLLGHYFEQDVTTVMKSAVEVLGGDAAYYLGRAIDDMEVGSRGMSSLGILVFDFGILGLGLYAATVYFLLGMSRHEGLRGLSAIIAVGTLGYLTQVPFSYPTVLVLMSTLAFSPSWTGGQCRRTEQ